MKKHTANRIESLAWALIVIWAPLLLVKPSLLSLSLILFVILQVYIIQIANGNIKRLKEWYKKGMRDARVRRFEREEWAKQYRKDYGYKL
jgi:hypothetical protein